MIPNDWFMGISTQATMSKQQKYLKKPAFVSFAPILGPMIPNVQIYAKFIWILFITSEIFREAMDINCPWSSIDFRMARLRNELAGWTRVATMIIFNLEDPSKL